jgi:hypothetical protein
MAQGQKISVRVWKEFLRLYAENVSSVSRVCKILGISPNAFYNKCRQDKVFAEKIRRIKEQVRVQFAEDILFSLIGERDLGAIKYFLSNRGGRDWNNSKIVPIVVKHEIYNPPKVEGEKQGLPDHAAMIAGAAYEAAMDLGLDEVPKKLTIDLSQIVANIKNPRQRKRMLEDNQDFYFPDESKYDTGKED